MTNMHQPMRSNRVDKLINFNILTTGSTSFLVSSWCRKFQDYTINNFEKDPVPFFGIISKYYRKPLNRLVFIFFKRFRVVRWIWFFFFWLFSIKWPTLTNISIYKTKKKKFHFFLKMLPAILKKSLK